MKQEHKQVSSTIVFNNVLNLGLCTEATGVTAEVILVFSAAEGGAMAAGPLVNVNEGRRELCGHMEDFAPKLQIVVENLPIATKSALSGWRK